MPKKPAVVGLSLDDILPSQPPMRQDVKLLPLLDRDKRPSIPKELKWKQGKQFRGKGTRIVTYVGAAGDEDLLDAEESKIKEMSDPYREETRKDFTNCAYSDPTLGPALENRNNSFFENGFDLTLELTELIGEDGKPMQDEERDAKMKVWTPIYAPHLQRIINWSQKKDIALLEKMKAAHISSVVQGRSLTLVTPPLSILPLGGLPDSLTNLSTDETGNPLVDTVRRKLVAIKLKTRARNWHSLMR
jgi:hypothetical protein